jgi:hypothetical protein
MMGKPGYDEMFQPQDCVEKKPRQSAGSICLSASIYDILFSWVKTKDPGVVHQDTFPLPRGRKKLSGYAKTLLGLKCGATRVAPIEPQNCAVACVGNKVKYGLVKQIYMYKSHLGKMEHAILCAPTVDLYPKRVNLPTSRFCFALYQLQAVVGVLASVSYGPKPRKKSNYLWFGTV